MNIGTTLFSMLAPSAGGAQGLTQSDAETSFAATLLLVTGNLGGEDSADVNADPSMRPSQVVPSTDEPAEEMVPSLELLVLMTDPVDGDGVEVGKRVAEVLYDALTTLLAHGQRSGDATRHEVADDGDLTQRVAQPSNVATRGASRVRQDVEGGRQSAMERGVGQLVVEAEAFPDALAFGAKPTEPALPQSGQESADPEVPSPSGTGSEDASQAVAADYSPSQTMHDVEFPAAVTVAQDDSVPAELNQQNGMTRPPAEQTAHLAMSSLGDVRNTDAAQVAVRTLGSQSQTDQSVALEHSERVQQHLESGKTADPVRNQEVPAEAITKLSGDRTHFNQTTSEPAARVDRQVSSKAQPEVLTAAAAVGKDGMSLGKDEGLRASITGGQWQEPSINSSGGGRPLVQRQVRQPSAQTSEVTPADVAGSSGKVVILPEIDTVRESVHRLVSEATDASVARPRPNPGPLAQHSGAGMERRDGQAQPVHSDASRDREGRGTLTSKPKPGDAHKPAATTGDAGSGEPMESVVNTVSNGEAKLGAPIDGFPSAPVQSQFVKATPVKAGLQATDASLEAPTPHTDWVTLRVDTAGQGTVRIRVAVMGNHVRATILHEDAGVAAQLSTRVGDLRQALVRQGFSESQLSIQPAPSSQQLAAAGSTWQPARFNSGTATSPELLDSDQRSPNDRGRDRYDDSYDRRDTSQRRRQNQRER